MLFSLPACPDPDAEMLLNEYIDGELDSAREPELFGHLASCSGCRRQFEAALAFRLAVRQEPLAVPPALDQRVLARLDTTRRQRHRRPDRQADRAPLAGALRRRISVGAALAVTLVAVTLAAMLPPPGLASQDPTRSVRLARVYLDDGPLYVIDHAVTVEAERDEEVEG
ncbi:MAG: zf-HC2 domain-containing protein [Bacteroidota bacterium]